VISLRTTQNRIATWQTSASTTPRAVSVAGEGEGGSSRAGGAAVGWVEVGFMVAFACTYFRTRAPISCEATAERERRIHHGDTEGTEKGV
jgi:hypothetical protein